MRGFTIASVIVLVVVVAVIGTAAVLLARTVQEAQSINDKAQNIATTGRGINTATDSVIQLTRTNKLARSILKSAKPLDTQLGGIVGTAQGIDGLAGSINSSAGSINSTAGSINASAGRINTSAGSINSAAGAINSTARSINSSAGSINSSAGSINSSAGSINSSAGAINKSAGAINTTAGRIDSLAASILGTARRIDTDVRLINTNLNVTLDLVTAVKGDTGNILGQAGGANDTAACIDRKLGGAAGEDGDCQGQPTPSSSASSRQRGTAAPPEAQSITPEDLRKLLPKAPPPASGDPVPDPKLRDRLPQPEVPKVPKVPEAPRTLDDILDTVLPGPDRNPPEARPPGNLLEQALPGLGQ